MNRVVEISLCVSVSESQFQSYLRWIVSKGIIDRNTGYCLKTSFDFRKNLTYQFQSKCDIILKELGTLKETFDMPMAAFNLVFRPSISLPISWETIRVCNNNILVFKLIQDSFKTTRTVIDWRLIFYIVHFICTYIIELAWIAILREG